MPSLLMDPTPELPVRSLETTKVTRNQRTQTQWTPLPIPHRTILTLKSVRTSLPTRNVSRSPPNPRKLHKPRDETTPFSYPSAPLTSVFQSAPFHISNSDRRPHLTVRCGFFTETAASPAMSCVALPVSRFSTASVRDHHSPSFSLAVTRLLVGDSEKKTRFEVEIGLFN